MMVQVTGGRCTGMVQRKRFSNKLRCARPAHVAIEGGFVHVKFQRKIFRPDPVNCELCHTRSIAALAPG